MTDEKGNKGTKMWPSAQNIVRLLSLGTIYRIPSTLTTPNLQLQAIDDLVRDASPRDVFVFYCMLRLGRHPVLPP